MAGLHRGRSGLSSFSPLLQDPVAVKLRSYDDFFVKNVSSVNCSESMGSWTRSGQVRVCLSSPLL